MGAVVLVHRVASVHVGSVFRIAYHGQHHDGVFVPMMMLAHDDIDALALIICLDGR